MISRVSLSKSKVSKRSGFWVSRKVKTWIDRFFWLNLYLFKSPELISRKKWPPRPEAAVPRAIQGNRSYHGLTDQFNVSNGSISNIMMLFLALGGELHRFATKKLQFATPNRISNWFGYQKGPLIQTRSSSKRICRRKTWFQPVLPPPKEGYGMLIHMPVTRQQNI
jgi:hypothetical protein